MTRKTYDVNFVVMFLCSINIVITMKDIKVTWKFTFQVMNKYFRIIYQDYFIVQQELILRENNFNFEFLTHSLYVKDVRHL